MTDHLVEINEMVARKLGWTPATEINANWHRVLPEGAQIHVGGAPPYSTEIKRAWEIIERPGLAWQIFKYVDGSYGAVVHDAAVAGEAQGASASEAICRAFLELPVKLP